MENKNNKILIGVFIFIVLSFIVYWFFLRKQKSKYYKYFNEELGFGDIFLNKFTKDELKTSYEYLEAYPRQNKELTMGENPLLYAKVKAINDKFGIFSSSLK